MCIISRTGRTVPGTGPGAGGQWWWQTPAGRTGCGFACASRCKWGGSSSHTHPSAGTPARTRSFAWSTTGSCGTARLGFAFLCTTAADGLVLRMLRLGHLRMVVELGADLAIFGLVWGSTAIFTQVWLQSPQKFSPHLPCYSLLRPSSWYLALSSSHSQRQWREWRPIICGCQQKEDALITDQLQVYILLICSNIES